MEPIEYQKLEKEKLSISPRVLIFGPKNHGKSTLGNHILWESMYNNNDETPQDINLWFNTCNQKKKQEVGEWHSLKELRKLLSKNKLESERGNFNEYFLEVTNNSPKRLKIVQMGIVINNQRKDILDTFGVINVAETTRIKIRPGQQLQFIDEEKLHLGLERSAIFSYINRCEMSDNVTILINIDAFFGITLMTPTISFESSENLLCIDTDGFENTLIQSLNKNAPLHKKTISRKISITNNYGDGGGSNNFNMIEIISMAQNVLEIKEDSMASLDIYKEASSISGFVYVLRNFGSDVVEDQYIDILYKMMLSFTLTYKENLNLKSEDLPFVAVVITGLSRDECSSCLHDEDSSFQKNYVDPDSLIEHIRSLLAQKIYDVQYPGIDMDEAKHQVDILLPENNFFFFQNNFEDYSRYFELEEIKNFKHLIEGKPVFSLKVKHQSNLIKPVIRDHEDVNHILNYFGDKLEVLERFVKENDRFLCPNTEFSRGFTPSILKESIYQVDNLQCVFNFLNSHKQKRVKNEHLETFQNNPETSITDHDRVDYDEETKGRFHEAMKRKMHMKIAWMREKRGNLKLLENLLEEFINYVSNNIHRSMQGVFYGLNEDDAQKVKDQEIFYNKDNEEFYKAIISNGKLRLMMITKNEMDLGLYGSEYKSSENVDLKEENTLLLFKKLPKFQKGKRTDVLAYKQKSANSVDDMVSADEIYFKAKEDLKGYAIINQDNNIEIKWYNNEQDCYCDNKIIFARINVVDFYYDRLINDLTNIKEQYGVTNEGRGYEIFGKENLCKIYENSHIFKKKQFLCAEEIRSQKNEIIKFLQEKENRELVDMKNSPSREKNSRRKTISDNEEIQNLEINDDLDDENVTKNMSKIQSAHIDEIVPEMSDNQKIRTCALVKIQENTSQLSDMTETMLLGYAPNKSLKKVWSQQKSYILEKAVELERKNEEEEVLKNAAKIDVFKYKVIDDKLLALNEAYEYPEFYESKKEFLHKEKEVFKNIHKIILEGKETKEKLTVIKETSKKDKENEHEEANLQAHNGKIPKLDFNKREINTNFQIKQSKKNFPLKAKNELITWGLKPMPKKNKKRPISAQVSKKIKYIDSTASMEAKIPMSRITTVKNLKNLNFSEMNMDQLSAKLSSKAQRNQKKFDKIFDRDYAIVEKNLTFKPKQNINAVKKIYMSPSANPFLTKPTFDTETKKKIKLKKDKNAMSAISFSNYKMSKLRERTDIDYIRPSSAITNIKSQSLLKINNSTISQRMPEQTSFEKIRAVYDY